MGSVFAKELGKWSPWFKKGKVGKVTKVTGRM